VTPNIRSSRAVAVALVTLAAFIDLVTYSVAVPVLPDLSRRLGASPTLIGFLFSSFGLTLLIVSVPMGAVSDRVGRKTPMVAGLVALAAANALFAFADAISWLFAARLIQGAADAVTWVVGFALVADLYGPAERGRVMGFVMAGSNFGLMIGPTLGGWLYETGGMQLPFLSVAALALATAAAFLWLQIPGKHGTHQRTPFRLVVRERAVLTVVLVVVVAASTIAMLEPVLALWFSASLGLTPTRVGLVFGVAAVAAVVLHPVYGHMADRWGGRRLSMVGLVATAAMLPILSRAWSFESAVVLYVCQAAAMALVVTPSLAFMGEAVSAAGAGSFGVAYGIYNFAWGLGLLAGPAIGGAMYERMGFPSLTLAWMPLVLVITFLLARARSAGAGVRPI
jgi:DHA1 family solute carrier family 18 vesicular amine transporter 1/2